MHRYNTWDKRLMSVQGHNNPMGCSVICLRDELQDECLQDFGCCFFLQKPTVLNTLLPSTGSDCILHGITIWPEINPDIATTWPLLFPDPQLSCTGITILPSREGVIHSLAITIKTQYIAFISEGLHRKPLACSSTVNRSYRTSAQRDPRCIWVGFGGYPLHRAVSPCMPPQHCCKPEGSQENQEMLCTRDAISEAGPITSQDSVLHCYSVFPERKSTFFPVLYPKSIFSAPEGHSFPLS